MSLLRRIIHLVLLLALVVPAAVSPASDAHAQDGAWAVESITPLEHLVPLASQRVVVSPNAARVAAIIPEDGHNLACMFNFTVAPPPCVSLPEEAGRGFMPGLLPPVVWAPDSQRLAVVGSPLILFVDNDLTVVDFAAKTATVLAPDDTTGSLPLREPGNAIIDVQPAWSPDGTRIAVERTEWSDDDRIARIAILDAESGAELSSLTLPKLAPDGINFGVTMALAWAPDGTSLAWSRYAPGVAPEDNGVWLIDVETGDAEPIVSMADMQPYMTTPNADHSLVSGFVWAPDGSAALVWVQNPVTGEQRALLYDAETDMLSAPPRPAGMEEGHTDIDAAWSSDGGALILSSAVRKGHRDRMLVDVSPSDGTYALWIVDRATSTSDLLGYLPRMPVPSPRGAWNADGFVLLAGYELQLSHE